MIGFNIGCEDVQHPLRDEDVDFYKSKLDVYDLIIPRFYHHRLNELDKKRVELLINEECLLNCKNYVKHFDKVSAWNRKHDRAATLEEIEKIHGCKIPCEKFYEKANKTKKELGILYPFDLEHRQVLHLLEKGFNNFKLRGRDEEDKGYEYYLDKYITSYVESSTS